MFANIEKNSFRIALYSEGATLIHINVGFASLIQNFLNNLLSNFIPNFSQWIRIEQGFFEIPNC